MKLRTARNILYIACAVMVLFFIIGAAIDSILLMIIGMAAAFAGAAVWLIFGHCPSCGKFLGRTYDKFCSQCGAKIEW